VLVTPRGFQERAKLRHNGRHGKRARREEGATGRATRATLWGITLTRKWSHRV
jgi:hypothetical protein